MVKKIWRYVYSFWHDPRTWQTDRRTPHDGYSPTAPQKRGVQHTHDRATTYGPRRRCNVSSAPRLLLSDWVQKDLIFCCRWWTRILQGSRDFDYQYQLIWNLPSLFRNYSGTVQVSPHPRSVSENQVKKLIAVPKLCAPKTKLGLSTSIRMTYLSLGYPFND